MCVRNVHVMGVLDPLLFGQETIDKSSQKNSLNDDQAGMVHF